jgi:hypothetical protein
MPRQESQESESEPLEINFQMERPQATSSSASSTNTSTTSRTEERSVFARVREEAQGSRRHEPNDDEYNPFDFTSQDDPPHPPVSKRRRKREIDHQAKQSKSDPKATKFRKISQEHGEPTFDRGRSLLEKDDRSDGAGSSSVVSELEEPKRFQKVTKTKVTKTVTTMIHRIITITTKKEGTDEIIEEVTYEEEDMPRSLKTEEESVEEENIIEKDDSTYEIVRQPQTQRPVENIRKSPRGKKRGEALANNTKSKRQRTYSNSELTSNISSNVDSRTGKSPRVPSREGNGIHSPPLLRRESTDKIVEDKDCSRTPEPALQLTPGTRVFAHWSDNYFYPGVLTSSASKLGLYNVTFDDGDKRKVRPERLILRDSLHVGQHVLAQDADGYYDPGVIVGHYRCGAENGYEIKDSRGNIKRYPTKTVILTEEQAAAILSSSSSLSRTTSGSSASVGGVNTRPRSSRSMEEHGSSSRSSASNVSIGGLNTRSRESSAKDTSCSSNDWTHRQEIAVTSPKPKETNNGDETPKSSRKKTVKKFTKVRKLQPQSWRGTQGLESTSSEASSDAERDKRTRVKRGARRGLGKLLSVPTRTSPRKQQPMKDKTDTVRNDESSALGPLRPDDSLFAGFAFLITGCQNVKDQKDESTDSESEIIEFNRQNLIDQIEDGGGVVLKDFEETQTSGADQCFLISSSHQRTKKFFQCLAYNISIVHHMWIEDSSTLNRLQDYKKYILPAGTSLETEEVMECGTQPRPKILQGLKVRKRN